MQNSHTIHSYKNAADFSSATGKVRYNMTNDYMFRVVLQKDNPALKGLIASLLHLDFHSIVTAEVVNPIIIGEDIDTKEYILDLLVLLNDKSSINLEMQVKNLGNWVPRSLSYITRQFQRLRHGDDYSEIKPVIHVGFLDFTLFSDHPEFYGTYRLKNIRDGYQYSDILTLSVVELNHIDLATEEDRRYGIDKWARLFKATTWEEIKMLARLDPNIASAARTMFASSVDDSVIEACRRRQEEIDGDEHRRQRLAELEIQNSEQATIIADKDAALAKKDATIANQSKALSEKDQEIAKLRAQLASVAQ